MSENIEVQNALVPVSEPMVMHGEIVDEEQLERTRRNYVAQIETSWQKSIDGIFEVGRLLNEAKKRIDHGKFVEMIYNDLPFSDSTAVKLMKVAKDQRLAALMQAAKALPAPDGEAAAQQEYFHVMPKRVLPASWGTLYELTQLTDAQFKYALEEGFIHASLERRDAIRLKDLSPSNRNPTVRSVKQPLRKGQSEAETEQKTPAQKNRIPETVIVVDPAEALILELLYRNAVEFGRVHEWVAQNWPQEGESQLKTVKPLDIERLKTKLANTVASLGL
ncbi:MAG: dmnA [Magnetococcales bacterium]|nr:dmnA [Magnetococcales bacterium]HIJ83542.1 DUF3102 domain-containing protein [Magnetococcales bacterium]